ncbi:T9SS type A sorting domain-containing protein [Patescibacteria group bacterium]
MKVTGVIVMLFLLIATPGYTGLVDHNKNCVIATTNSEAVLTANGSVYRIVNGAWQLQNVTPLPVPVSEVDYWEWGGQGLWIIDSSGNFWKLPGDIGPWVNFGSPPNCQPVAVTLQSLYGERVDDVVRIIWEVSLSVPNNVTFRVYRDNFGPVSSPLAGQQTYEFVDTDAPWGELTYWLLEVSDGIEYRHGPVKVSAMPKPELSLENHPNPFNPTTTIHYTVPDAGKVTLAVYDVNGRLIENLINGEYREAKAYEVTYKPDTTTGVYFVRLTVGKQTTAQKIVLLK